MANVKAPGTAAADRPASIDASFAKPLRAGAKALGAAREQELTEVDREIIGALADFRDALRDRTPLETKYTVRHVVVVVPPPQLGPEDVRKTREVLGVSQPVFADFLGTSPSTIRSWEQGQKPPSPMARRLLGLIASDPSYWKSQFCSMVKLRGGEQEASGAEGARLVMSRERPTRVVHRRRGGAIAKKGSKSKARPKSKA
jgi:putative transcriptional regulator